MMLLLAASLASILLAQCGCALPPLPSDSKFADRVLYVSTEQLHSVDMVDDLVLANACKASVPPFCDQNNNIMPIIQQYGGEFSVKNIVATFNDTFEYSAMLSNSCMNGGACFNNEGQWFWWPGNRSTAVFVGSDWQSMVEFGPSETGNRTGDPPVKYWTGVDAFDSNAKACTSDNQRWSSVEFINEPAFGALAQGASVGIGFNTLDGAWYGGGVERCNSTLPVMCACKVLAPAFVSAKFTQTGQLHITFDGPTNGLTLGSFPCSDIYTIVTAGSQFPLQASEFGTCKFISDTVLVATLPRIANARPGSHQLVFQGNTTRTGPVELLGGPTHKYAHKIRDKTGTRAAMFPPFPTSLTTATGSECFPGNSIIFETPRAHAVCSDILPLKFSMKNDAGRPMEISSIRLTVNPCIINNEFWELQQEECVYIGLTPAEVIAGEAKLNVTGMSPANNYFFQMRGMNWLDSFMGCGYSFGTAHVLSMQGIVADVILPSTVTILQSQPFSQVPRIHFDPKCAPAGNTPSSFTLSFFWSVREFSNPVARRLETAGGNELSFNQARGLTQNSPEILNRTTRVFSIPKHALLSRRAIPDSRCLEGEVPAGSDPCVNTHLVELYVTGHNGTGEPIDIGFSSMFLDVAPTALFLDFATRVNPDNSVTLDATKTCDPDIAIKSCLPLVGFIPTFNESRGVFLSPPECETVAEVETSIYIFSACSPDDFVNGTESPTSSPQIATEQPTQSPDAYAPQETPPTRAPTVFYGGVSTTQRLKPGTYRFTQRVTVVAGGQEYMSEATECSGDLKVDCTNKYQRIVDIFPNIPTCVIPQVTIAPIPSRVTQFPGGPISIAGFVTRNGVRVEDGVVWQVQDAGTFKLLANNVSISVLDSSKFIQPATRPNLAIPPNALQEEQTYKFRLVAASQGQECVFPFASQTVTFTLNGRPSGGSVYVSNITGTSALTVFTVTTSGWADQDLPLKYSFEFLAPGDRFPTPITDFGLDTSIETVLSSSKREGNVVIVTAMDILGAKSSASSEEITLNPLYDPLVGTADLPVPATVLAQLQNASPDERLRAVLALASSASSTRDVESDQDKEFLQRWRRDVAQQTLNAVKTAREITGGGSIRQVSLQINTLLSGLSAESNLGETLTEDVSELVKSIVEDARQAFFLSGFSGVGAADVLPPNFGGSLLDTLSQLSKGVEAGIAASGLRRRRRLVAPMLAQHHRTSAQTNRDLQELGDGYSRTVENLRTALLRLISTLMQGYVPGAPLKEIKGAQIEVSISRESRSLVGSSLQHLSLGNTSVSLPPSVLDPQFFRQPPPDGAPDEVDVALVRFKFNIRELAEAGNLPPGFDPDNITVDGAIADNFTVQEVTTLLFISSTDATALLDPYNLSEPLNITIPLPEGYELPDPNTTGLTLACGAWDTSFSGWSSEGCTVVSISSTQIVCSCTHASDYAAWNAFVSNLGGGPVGVILAIALVVVGIMLPLISLFYIAAMFWAHSRDKRDADGVHAGALLLLTKNKLRLRAKQRKFFQLLRDNAKDPQPLIVDLVRAHKLKKDKVEALSKQREQLRRKVWYYRYLPMVLLRWVEALKYDHSVFGVFTRFDPYYTRTQRVTVVTSVICGNLFVASFLFDLKTAQDITVGFTVGVIFVAAMIVAIPVKIIIRVLFRQSEAVTGSMMDRVTQIYRVSYINQDILPVYASAAEQADLQMILAFRHYYLVKSDVANAKHLLKLAQRKASGKRRSLCASCCNALRGKHVDDDALLLMKTQKITERGVLTSADKAEKGIYDLNELSQAVQKAEAAFVAAAVDLKEKSRIAKEEWAKVPRKNPRVETLRKQQSTIMKFAALLYDEADSGPPRERTKRCKASFLIIAWILVIAYLITCLAFTAYWLIAYTSIKDGDQAERQQDANQVILTWLLASVLGVVIGLFVSEPIVQLVRFGLIPMCLDRCGNGIVSGTRKSKLFAARKKNQKGEVVDEDDDDDESVHGDDDVEKQEVAPKDKQMLAVRAEVSDAGIGSIRTKAQFQDEYVKQVQKKGKGDTHAESAGAAFFDLAAEVVEAIA